MNTPLKILILEDSLEDVEMVIRMLRRENMQFDHCIAMTRDEYVFCLDTYQPDVILSDNSLPQFNAREALLLLREKDKHTPFILVTGTVSEEFAAQIIRQGADDYLLKDRLARLPSAIEGALRQRREAKEKQEVVNRLRISEENLSAIFQNASEAFILTDMDFNVKSFNNNAARYVSLNTGHVLCEGTNVFHFLNADRQSAVRDILTKVIAGEKIEYDRLYVKENTPSLWLHFCMTPVWQEGIITGTCITAWDITEQKRSENLRQAMEREVFNQRVQAQKEVARAIIKGQEGERNRIGQELHDNVNQILAGTKMFLSSAGKDERLRPLIQYPLELIDKCMNEIRALSRKHVTPLKDINLQQLVANMLDDLQRNTPLTTEFIYHVDHDVEDDLKLNLYRIVQEQVNNVVKHAEASHITVMIEGQGKEMRVLVADNGKGFDVKQQRRGIGISNMINRVDLFNGDVVIESAPGEGTRVRITIPG